MHGFIPASFKRAAITAVFKSGIKPYQVIMGQYGVCGMCLAQGGVGGEG